MVFGRRLHKLEKLVSDPYLLYLANKNMFKLKLKKNHIILILSQPVFALSPQCCVLSGEATHANCIILVWPDRGTNRRSTAREASTLTITPPMRFLFLWRDLTYNDEEGKQLFVICLIFRQYTMLWIYLQYSSPCVNSTVINIFAQYIYSYIEVT